MKKVLVMVALVMISVIVYAFNDSRETNQGKKEVTGNSEVVVMNKEMFLKDVFDYEKSKEWKHFCAGIQHHAAVCAELAEVSRKDRRTDRCHFILLPVIF